MDKPISREDALKALDEMSYKSPHESATSVVRKKHFGEILEKFIMQQPSAQKKGHWIFKREEHSTYTVEQAVCSECGEPCATYGLDKPRDRFCKWCGADMREEEE